MKARLLSAAVALPLLFLLIWVGAPWLFTLVVVLVAVLGAREFAHLLMAAGLHPQRQVMLLWVGSVVVSNHLGGWFPWAALTGGVLLSLALLLGQGPSRDTLAGWGATLAGVLYLGWTLSHAPLLFSLDQGREWVLFWLATTFATDTGAFFTGRAFGRHPLAPVLSPGKTWEGAVGGWVAGVGAAAALAVLLLLSVAWWLPLLLGGLVGIGGQVGDLVESLFKRSAQLKEAGHLVPGHGGLLDRLDSVVFTLPLVYYGVVALGGG